MKYIYYPEYELEYRNLLKGGNHPNHILNIKLLMFLCDHVILPPSHLLYTSSENILSLIKHLKNFFDAGKIVTIRYQSSIDDYFDSRIDRIQDPVLKLEKEIRANLIKNELFFNNNVEHNQSNEKMQLSLFDTRIKELIHGSPIHKKKSLLLLDRMNAVSDSTGEPVYSNQFKNILSDMVQCHDITKQQNRDFLNLMSNAYYYSGTFTMNTLVSYNSYFSKIDLQKSLINTHAKATNLIVDPYFLQRLFTSIGINIHDIYQLDILDYKKIMSHEHWGNFMAIFDKLYTSAQELEELLKHREALIEIYQKRKGTTSKFLDWFINDIIPGLILIPFNPFLGFGVSIVISALKKFFPAIIRFESSIDNYACDKILYLISRNKDPLYEFSYRLNAVIRELK